MSTIHCCFQPKVPFDENIMSEMLKASGYWTPDAVRQTGNRDNTCRLAKANLFNTALSKNDFVHTDSQTGSIISANARLDNRAQLLKQLNMNKETITDGELILHAYQQWGNACPKYLLGDFAFIIWDAITRKVFCARDHFGVKLLLYSRTDRGVMLSNEPEAFFTSGWLNKEIEEPWLIKKLWGLGSEPVKTAYKGLDIVPAGHYMEIDANNIVTESYWKLTDNTQWKGMSDEDLLSELKRRFQHAVEVRLESDYPLACELSEGLDSNGIAGYTATIKPKEIIHTLSFDCTELTDETRPVWEKTYQDIFEMLNMHDNLRPVWTREQPDNEDKTNLIKYTGGVFFLRAVWLWHCRLAQQKDARVLLSGWGGDHCVSTYGNFYESELFNALQWSKLHQLLKDKYKRGRGGRPVKAWILLLMKHFTPPLAWWYNRTRGGLEHALWQRCQYSLLKDEHIKHYRLTPRLKAFVNGYHSYYSTKAHHRRELFDIGVEDRLIDSELCARMFRVEFRYPMLDIPLVEFAYNLPSHLKIYKGIERYAYRKILEGKTTERIRWRLKSDVNFPNRERLSLSKQEKQELQNLLQTPFLQKYCQAKVPDLQNPESKFMVNRFKIFLPTYRYYADNNIPVNNKYIKSQ